MGKRTVAWSAAASAIAFFVTGLFPFQNSDGFGHLAQGRQIAELGRVPRVDSFSIWKPTPQLWTNYEWGYDLASWWIYDHWGAAGLVLLKCLALGFLGAALVWLAVRLANGTTKAAPLALGTLFVALPLSRFRLTVRPQLVGLVFPAVLLLGIHRLYDARLRAPMRTALVVALGAMQVVWVNFHGSHLFGLAITAIFTVAAVRTPAFASMSMLLAAQVLATGLSPFGFSIAADALGHVSDPQYRGLLLEWAGWTPDDPLRFVIAPTVASLCVLAFVRPVSRGSRFGLGYAVLCVLLSLMALRSMRFIAHQLLYVAPFVAAGLAQTRTVRSWKPAAVVGAVLGGGLLSAALFAEVVQPFGFGLGEDTRDYPMASAAALRADVEQPRILASMSNSWVLLHAVDDARVLIDGRVPFYGPAFFDEIRASYADPRAFAAVLRDYDINAVVIDHLRAAQIRATNYLMSSTDWRLAMVEDRHALFVRDAQAGTAPGFAVIGPGYTTGRVFDPEVTPDEIEAERERLHAYQGTEGIDEWVRGLVLLGPLARDRDRAGFRTAKTLDEGRAALEAAESFEFAERRAPGYAPIALFAAMAKLSACDGEGARSALARSRGSQETRTHKLIGLEVALRSGTEEERTAALDYLERLKASPESARDPWVQAIDAESGRRCPAP